jgi:hypothetical protein
MNPPGVARGGRGLFSGFEGYRTPSDKDYQQLLTGGLVVPDANVLLNLIAMMMPRGSHFCRFFFQLGERLWIPHQVLFEFWANRQRVLRDPRDTQKTVKELGELRDRAVVALRTWANRVSLAATQTSALLDPFVAVYTALIAGVNALDEEDASIFARDTSSNPVLKALEPILLDKCGAPLLPRTTRRPWKRAFAD